MGARIPKPSRLLPSSIKGRAPVEATQASSPGSQRRRTTAQVVDEVAAVAKRYAATTGRLVKDALPRPKGIGPSPVEDARQRTLGTPESPAAAPVAMRPATTDAGSPVAEPVVTTPTAAAEPQGGNEWEIDGEFTFPGELSVGGQFIVGPVGNVAVDIATVDAVILGRYAGHLRASGRIYVSTLGVVSGRLEAPDVVVAEGATVTAEIVRTGLRRDGARTSATASGSSAENSRNRSTPEVAPPTAEVERDVEIFIPARPHT